MKEVIPVSGEDLKLYTLRNILGTEVEIMNLGATIFNFYIWDKNGKKRNVLVGPKFPEDYLTDEYFQEDRCFGSSVGRYAGRISNGKFSIKNTEFQLYEKEGVHLHGGRRGFQSKFWTLVLLDEEENSILFSYFSQDGEEGYPGDLKVQVKYTLSETNQLKVEYFAETNKATPINLVNHNYYNLNGGKDVSDHELYIAAGKILEVDEKQRPTGEFVPLEQHPKNFSLAKQIGRNEVDDTFVLIKEEKGDEVFLFAPQTGIELKVNTNQPAVVIFIPEELPEKWEYKSELTAFPSICIETQNFPDAPNHENFPSAILQPGETYHNCSTFNFRIISEH